MVWIECRLNLDIKISRYRDYSLAKIGFGWQTGKLANSWGWEGALERKVEIMLKHLNGVDQNQIASPWPK